jgi:hypothetical protein
VLARYHFKSLFQVSISNFDFKFRFRGFVHQTTAATLYLLQKARGGGLGLRELFIFFVFWMARAW